MIVEHVKQADEVEDRRPIADLDTLDDSTPASYRSVSKTAVMTLVFAILSMSVWLSSVFLIFPAIGFILGVFALLGFRRFPDELIGRPVAKYSFGFCALSLVGGIAYHVYSYNTEVPPDYQRISFSILKPQGPTPFATATEELDGKKVFIKGYVRPSQLRRNLKNFILVGDFGQCCFGGSPKMTNVIAVTLEGKLRVDYGWGLRHIGGVFHLNKRPRVSMTDKDVPRSRLFDRGRLSEMISPPYPARFSFAFSTQQSFRCIDQID